MLTYQQFKCAKYFINKGVKPEDAVNIAKSISLTDEVELQEEIKKEYDKLNKFQFWCNTISSIVALSWLVILFI